MYRRIYGTGFRGRQNDLLDYRHGHILSNNLGARFICVEHARNAVVCKNIRLHLPVNMVCGHHSHAPRCESSLLDIPVIDKIRAPTKLLGVQSILSGDIVNMQSLKNILRENPTAIPRNTNVRTRLTKNLRYTPLQAHADGR
jgi:hypothetical protein